MSCLENIEPTNEGALIRRCCQGDAEGWNRLFDLHYAATARFVFQLDAELTREDAEEICQEVFLSVIRTLPTFRGRSQLRTWILRIATNKTRDFRERRQAAKRGGGQRALPLETVSSGLDDGNGFSPSLPAPDAALLQKEAAFQVRYAVNQLPSPCRELIELRYFGDLSYDEIGGVLGMNPKTVSSRLSKCLDRLEAGLQLLFGHRGSCGPQRATAAHPKGGGSSGQSPAMRPPPKGEASSDEGRQSRFSV